MHKSKWFWKWKVPSRPHQTSLWSCHLKAIGSYWTVTVSRCPQYVTINKTGQFQGCVVLLQPLPFGAAFSYTWPNFFENAMAERRTEMFYTVVFWNVMNHWILYIPNSHKKGAGCFFWIPIFSITLYGKCAKHLKFHWYTECYKYSEFYVII